MTDRRAIRMVCFDLGGVLVRICRTWEEGCRRAGVPFRPARDDEGAAEARRAIVNDHQTGRISGDEFFRRLSGVTGGVYSPGEVARIHHAWTIEEYPGVGGLLERLEGVAGVTTGILSNTNHEHWEKQLDPPDGQPRRYPSLRRVRHRHASHLLGLAKPSPEIYRAFERVTAAAPRDILFFDDLEENIAAARACGWAAEMIDHTGDTVGQIDGHLRAYGVT